VNDLEKFVDEVHRVRCELPRLLEDGDGRGVD
jgi:hypothetical protein